MLKTKKLVNSEYEFVRCLGEGLSSTVYEAIRSNSSGIQSERVAVKVLKSENSISWLQSEFESLRKVNSPHCVRVLGHEAFAEGPALILEFIEGVTLFDLGRSFQLSHDEISQIGAQVHAGLQAIQSASCAHGDLNPKNILVSRSGDIKLIDFGAFTSTTELIGSLPYISKQTWAGEKPSLESDLESWLLIAADLRSSFAQVPLDKESARVRASLAADAELINEARFVECEISRSSIAAKVIELLSAKVSVVQTSIVSRDREQHLTEAKKSPSRFRSLRIFAPAVPIFIALLFPAQNLLSEPLKAAEPAILLIRTHDWTELSVNGISKGYAPLNLQNLAPGKYRIKYKRPRGQGELTLHLNPGQKRLLRDADFKD